MIAANLWSPLFALILMIPLAGLYIAVWGAPSLQAVFPDVRGELYEDEIRFLILVILALIFGIGAHELIHAIAWTLVTGSPFASVVKFGIDWKALAPYALCKELVTVRAYRVGIAMPGIMLGVLPSLAAVAIGNFWVLVFGLLMVLGAGGDMMVLYKLRGVDAAKLVEDHPSRVGCFVIESAPDN